MKREVIKRYEEKKLRALIYKYHSVLCYSPTASHTGLFPELSSRGMPPPGVC